MLVLPCCKTLVIKLGEFQEKLKFKSTWSEAYLSIIVYNCGPMARRTILNKNVQRLEGE